MRSIPKDDVDLENESFDDDDDYQGLLASRNTATVTRESSPRYEPNRILQAFVTFIAYLQFFWIHRRSESIMFLILVTSITLAVTGTIEAYEMKRNKTFQKTHTIQHDYSDIKSQLELKLGNIDHWCLDGGDEHCNRCEDPTHPSGREESKPWGLAHMRNVRLAQAFVDMKKDVDVIFLGGSVIEALSGAFNGQITCSKTKEGENDDVCSTTLAKSKSKFDKAFDKEKGAGLNGLALGIAGDTSPNLLFRIQNNEMRDLKPKVWWVSIGINDIMSTKCSEEITLMGVLRNVEELMTKADDATIVIQSLLPFSTEKSGHLDGKRMKKNKYYLAIKRVNDALKKFAQKHKGVKFFDATQLFTENHGSNLYLNNDLFMDKFHLSVEGMNVFIQAASDELASIITKQNAPAPVPANAPSPAADMAETGTEEFSWKNDDDFMTGYYGLDEDGEWTFYPGDDYFMDD